MLPQGYQLSETNSKSSHKAKYRLVLDWWIVEEEMGVGGECNKFIPAVKNTSTTCFLCQTCVSNNQCYTILFFPFSKIESQMFYRTRRNASETLKKPTTEVRGQEGCLIPVCWLNLMRFQ